MSVWDFAAKRKNLITEELEVQCQRFSKIIKFSQSSTITSKNHQATKTTESSDCMANPKTESEKITSLMGQYLLKGYTLLDEYCLECQTPLMRRKFDPSFCIFCNELKGSTTHGFGTNPNPIDPLQPEKSSSTNHENQSDNSDSDLFSELDQKLKQVLRNLNHDLGEMLNLRTNSIEPSGVRKQHEDIVSVLNVIVKTIETRKLLNQNRQNCA